MAKIKKIEASLPVIYKTGKVVIGRNNVLWSLKNEPDKVKAVILSSNTPPEFEKEILSLIKESKYDIPIVKLSKTNIEIGDSLGRAHSISVLAIYDLGSAPLTEEAFNA